MLRLVTLRFLESYFRHRWLYLLPIVLMLIAGIAYLYLTPRQYSSYGTMYVQNKSLLGSLTGDAGPSSWRTAAQITSNEMQELLKTEAFVRAAIKKTDLEASMAFDPATTNETIEQFRNSVWVQPGGDNLIMFGATSKDPSLAEQSAIAMVSTYVTWNLNSDKQESEVAQAFFANLIEKYRQDVEENRTQLFDYLRTHQLAITDERPIEEQIEIQRLQSNLDRATDQLASALDKQESAGLALTKTESLVDQTYQVIDVPMVPIDPVTSLRSAAMTTALFPLVGVALSLAAIAGAALLDRSLRLGIDVRHGLELPLLAMVPDEGDVTPKHRRPRNSIVPGAEPSSTDTGLVAPSQVAHDHS